MLTNKQVFVRYAELKYLRKKLSDDIIVLKERCSLLIFVDIPAIQKVHLTFFEIRDCKR